LLDTIAVVHFIGDRGLVIVRARRCRASLIYVQMRSSGLSLVRRSSLQQGRNHQQIVDKYGGADK